MAVVVAAGEPERSQDRTMTTTGSGATGRLYTSPRPYILPVTFSPQPFAPGIKLGRVRERERGKTRLAWQQPQALLSCFYVVYFFRFSSSSLFFFLLFYFVFFTSSKMRGTSLFLPPPCCSFIVPLPRSVPLQKSKIKTSLSSRLVSCWLAALQAVKRYRRRATAKQTSLHPGSPSALRPLYQLSFWHRLSFPHIGCPLGTSNIRILLVSFSCLLLFFFQMSIWSLVC